MHRKGGDSRNMFTTGQIAAAMVGAGWLPNLPQLPFLLLWAIGPLAIYLVLLSLIRLRGVPLVTTGGRDLAVLGMAIGGLVAIGPMQLFYPSIVGAALGWRVFVGLILLYVLSMTFAHLLMKPRLVIYGADVPTVLAALHRSIVQVIPEARCDEEGAYYAQAHLRFRVEGQTGWYATQVTIDGPPLTHATAVAVRRTLRQELRSAAPSPRAGAAALLATALCTLGWLSYQAISQRQDLAASLRDFLRIPQ
jgi:hypothetical protein